jgi:polar amino acid transport system permease protein
MHAMTLNPADDAARASRRPGLGYGLATVALAFVVFQLVWFAIQTPGFGWPTVLKYLTAPTVLQGLATSLLLTLVGMGAGIVLGIAAALLKLGPFVPGRWLASVYVWLFRGTPLLIQLIFWYNLAYLLPRVEIGLPFGPTWASIDTNTLITPVTAALLGLALNEGAYMSEIIRAGILSVDNGQRDAARAIGLRPAQIFWRVVLPQAMRFIVPPTGSQVIGMLKGTSLVSVIAMADLLFSVQAIYSRNFEVIPLLIVGVIWYLAMFSLLYLLLGWLERRYSRGHRAVAAA